MNFFSSRRAANLRTCCAFEFFRTSKRDVCDEGKYIPLPEMFDSIALMAIQCWKMGLEGERESLRVLVRWEAIVVQYALFGCFSTQQLCENSLILSSFVSRSFYPSFHSQHKLITCVKFVPLHSSFKLFKSFPWKIAFACRFSLLLLVRGRRFGIHE